MRSAVLLLPTFGPGGGGGVDAACIWSLGGRIAEDLSTKIDSYAGTGCGGRADEGDGGGGGVKFITDRKLAF